MDTSVRGQLQATLVQGRTEWPKIWVNFKKIEATTLAYANSKETPKPLTPKS
jgi:hypothetical protein